MGYFMVVDPVNSLSAMLSDISVYCQISPVSRLPGHNYEVNLMKVWKYSDIWEKGKYVGTLNYGNILYHSLFKLYV